MTASAPPAPCPSCGNPLDPARATYNKKGVLLCAACAANDQIAEGDARASSSIVGTAVGVLAGGILSWTCLNMFGILSIVTCASAIGWLVMISKNPALRTRLGGKLVPCVLATCFGLLGAGFALAIMAMGLLGAASTTHRYR
jgi:hypothetical protein